ncbi:MAG: hypothetical protein KDD62_00520 [Bdellovibrionales bacterium]|nr:hypothetical protein [Bdellovibrionales bacterium]
MKLCILVSGQARGNLDSLRHLAKEIQTLPPSIELTIIFSIWEKTGVKLDGVLFYWQFHRIVDSDVIATLPKSYYCQNFWKRFPQNYQRLKSLQLDYAPAVISSLFPDAIIDVESEQLLELEFEEPVGDSNSMRMLYKVWRANQIKNVIEHRDGEFDCVLRMRADQFVTIDPAISEALLPANTVFLRLSGDGPTWEIPDDMAYGTSKSMSTYANAFSRCFGRMGVRWRGVHEELASYFKQHGVNLENSTLVQGIKFDTNPLLSIADLATEDTYFKNIETARRALQQEGVQPALSHVNAFIEATNDESEQDAYRLEQTRILERAGRYSEALCSLLSADFSRYEIRFSKNDRSDLLFHAFCRICAGLSLLQKSDAYWAVMNTTKTMISLPLRDKNIERALQQDHWETTVSNYYVEFALKNNQVGRLLEIKDPSHISNGYACKIRDFAMEFEVLNIEIARDLMQLASSIRPDGAFITKKISEYDQRIRAKNRELR